MKILFIVPYTPNLIRVRSYNLIRELVRKGHSVTLATLWTDASEREDAIRLGKQLHEVASYPMPKWRSYWNCLAALPSDTPLQAVYSWQPAMAHDLNSLLSDKGTGSVFDVVHVEHMRSSRYGLRIKKNFPNLPVIWDSVDCISLLFQLASVRSTRKVSRYITSFELKRNRRYEAWLIRQFDHTLVTSRIDRDAMLELDATNGNRPEISVLPNGVDLEYFMPNGDIDREAETLVVTGKMSYHANVSMVMSLYEEIMPLIWDKRPGAKLWVVGKDPTPEISSLADHPNVLVTGTVEDMRPYLHKATVAVSPVQYSVGIQNKVLEAMACGAPVVSTSPAVSALDTMPGKDVLVADNPEGFANQVLKLLENPSLRREIGNSGLSYVKNHHKWSVITEQLEGVYHEAVENR